MTARHKLNSAAVHGVLVVAGLLCLVFRSWTIFLLVVSVLLGTAIHSGDIRLGPWRK